MSSTPVVSEAGIPPPPFTLVPVIPVLGGGSSSTEFRWCLTPSTKQTLTAARPKPWFVYLLVVVTNGDKEMSRQLFPIDQGQRYIRFFRPGSNIVHATIVYSDYKDPKAVLTKRDDDGDYAFQLIARRPPAGLADLDQLINAKQVALRHNPPSDPTERGRLESELELLKTEYAELEGRPTEVGLVSSFGSIDRIAEDVEVEMLISADAFGKPNWPITRWLADVYTKDSKSVDPCHTRRRAMAAIPKLIVLVFVGLVVMGILWPFNLLAVLVLLISGKRGIDYSALREPWKFMPNTIWKELRPSRWTHREINYRAYQPRAPIFRVVNPGVLVLAIALATIAGLVLGKFAVFGLLAAGLVVCTGVVIFATLAQAGPNQAEAERQAQKIKEDARRAQLLRLLEPVTCSTGESKQPRRKSFTLYYERAKKAVGCLPFAR